MIDKKLFSLVGKEKKYIYSITFFNIIMLLTNIVITAIVIFILHLALQGVFEVTAFLLLFIVILFCLGLRHFSTMRIEHYKNIMSNTIKRGVRAKVYAKILDLGLNYEKSKSSLLQMSIEGVEQLDTYFTLYLPKFFYALIAPLILFSILVFIEYRTALALLLCLPLIPIAIMFVRLRAKKIFAKYWGKYISLGDTFLDNIQGMREIKVFSFEHQKQIDIKKSAEEFRKVTMKVLVMQLSSITIMDLVAFGGAALAIVLAISAANTNQILPIAALFMILISAEFFLPMRGLGSAFHIAMNGATSGRNILDFLSLEIKDTGHKTIDKIDSIKIVDADFSYNDQELVLKNINMEFLKGFTAIVGKSGEGKSTIVKFLTRANDLKKGAVLINKLNINDLALADYYQKIALITSQHYIFNQSIRDNFLLYNSAATDEQMYEKLKEVNLKTFVEDIGGLDYQILEDSQNISCGQRQRLALAINLISEKDVYIFDEATNNIDSDSEQIILTKIKELSKSKIVIFISHSLYNLVDSDSIYFIEDKEIQESGTHLELLNKKAHYAKLFKKQQSLKKGLVVANDA